MFRNKAAEKAWISSVRDKREDKMRDICCFFIYGVVLPWFSLFFSYTTVQRGKTTVCTIYCHRAVSSLVCTGIVHLYRADGFGTCAFGVCLPGGNACHVSCGAMAGL